MAAGQSKDLAREELLELPETFRAESLYGEFEKLWAAAGSSPDFMRVAHSLILAEFWYAGLCRLLNDFCVMLGVVLVKCIIKSAEGDDTKMTLAFAALILVNSICQTILLQQFVHHVFCCGAKVVSLARTTVFYSMLSLRLHRASPARTIGEINNIQSKDASSLRDFIVFFHNLWACPLMIILCVFLLLRLLGTAGIVSVLLVGLLLPIESRISKHAKAGRKKILRYSDKRMVIINQLVDGFRTVKFTGLCSFVYKRAIELREAELLAAWHWMMVEAANIVITRSSTLLITLMTFLVYTRLSGDTLTADRAFSALAVINIIGRPMQLIPKCITLWSEARVSCARIEALVRDGQRLDSSLLSGRRPGALRKEDKDGMAGFSVDLSAVMATRLPQAEPVLVVDRLRFADAGLTLLLGENGSGKSTLLLLIMKELNFTGEVTVCPNDMRMALVSHDPWILNATVDENVLIAAPADFMASSSEALSAACLSVDVDEWPAGRATLIGERGVNISGGQKQRIALARALVSRAEVVLLDSPLSSLDTVVASKVFRDCVLRMAKTRRVIMATHDLALARDASQVVVMSGGRVAFCGSYSEYAASDEFVHLPPRSEQAAEEGASSKADGADPKKGDKAADRDTTCSSAETFHYYARCCGWGCLALCALLTLVAYGCAAFSDFLLSYWTDGYISAAQYLRFYALASLLVIAANAARYTMYAVASLKASGRLHDDMLHSVLGATLHFFTTTPSGRITSRFSVDMDTIDFSLPGGLSSLADSALGIITGVGVVAVSAPYYIVMLVPLVYQYLQIQGRYRKVSSALKRLESAAVGPLFSHFREVLDGLDYIRAYRIEDKVLAKHYALADEATVCRLNWDAANRWMGIRLDLIGALVVSAAAFAVALSGRRGGAAGLMVSYALKATQSLTFAIRASSALENMFVSCERVAQYASLPQEVCRGSGEQPLHAEIVAPVDKAGALRLKDIYVHHDDESAPVVKGVSTELRPGLLYGLCGRTGCGKSTLCAALARGLQLRRGFIELGSRDGRTMPLAEYRQQVQLFPQDSFIFAGPLRDFLDPQSLHDDAKLNELLGSLSTACTVAEKSVGDIGRMLGINTVMETGGANLSAGQKQVVALARIALSSASVVIMDEVTSNMDVIASKASLEVVRNELSGKGAVVLMVSHRLQDLERADVVIVMENGNIFESGPPQGLLATRGLFAQMKSASN